MNQALTAAAAAIGTIGAAFGARALLKASKTQGAKAGGDAAWKWGRKYFEGGFEPEMDRKEAAKVLGIRESACKEQVEDRYRSLMRFNHPDLGGSLFLSTKVNEAKELLLPRARSDPQWAIRQKRRKESREKRAERQKQREELAAAAKKVKEAEAKKVEAEAKKA